MKKWILGLVLSILGVAGIALCMKGVNPSPVGKFERAESGGWLDFKEGGYVSICRAGKVVPGNWKRMPYSEALASYGGRRRVWLDTEIQWADLHAKSLERPVSPIANATDLSMRSHDEEALRKSMERIEVLQKTSDEEFLFGSQRAEEVVVVTSDAGDFCWALIERGSDTLVSRDAVFIKK